MRVLELNFEKDWRGGERQTLYNMKGFREAGVTTHLICRNGSALQLHAQKEGFTVHSFDTIFGVIFFLATKGRQYDIIHAQTSHILTWGIVTKKLHGRKVLFTRRVNFVQKGFFTKLKYRFTDKIIAISEAVKNTLENFTVRKDIEVISDIVMNAEVNVEKARMACGYLTIGNRRIIGAVAALTPEKDPFTMIDAVKKLADQRNDFVFLHFGSGYLQEEISKKIAAFNLQQTYFLMGFVENIEDHIAMLEVLVSTSIEEGLGSSVLDAFINKVPVVSTNAGGLGELLKDERGILCEIKDSTAIAEGINRLLDDPLKKEAVINNANTYVRKYHGMEFITEKYMETIKNLNLTKT